MIGYSETLDNGMGSFPFLLLNKYLFSVLSQPGLTHFWFGLKRVECLLISNTVVRPNLSPWPYRTQPYRTLPFRYLPFSRFGLKKPWHRSLEPYRFPFFKENRLPMNNA